MANEWIKIRQNLPDDPDVKAIGRRIGADPESLGFSFIRVWSLGDLHAIPRHVPGRVPPGVPDHVPESEGFLPGYTPADIDQEARRPGFAQAMAAVGWLRIYEDGVAFPNWDIHHSTSAKTRASETKRKRRQRNQADQDGTSNGTRIGTSNGTKSPPEGEGDKEREKRSRKTSLATQRPRNEMFDVIVETSGADPKANGGRIGKLAAEITAAGITPEEFRAQLPEVVRTYAPYRTALDLGTIQACWPWIKTPPATTGAGKASRGDQRTEYAKATLLDALGAEGRPHGGVP